MNTGSLTCRLYSQLFSVSHVEKGQGPGQEARHEYIQCCSKEWSGSWDWKEYQFSNLCKSVYLEGSISWVIVLLGGLVFSGALVNSSPFPRLVTEPVNPARLAGEGSLVLWRPLSPDWPLIATPFRPILELDRGRSTFVAIFFFYKVDLCSTGAILLFSSGFPGN